MNEEKEFPVRKGRERWAGWIPQKTVDVVSRRVSGLGDGRPEWGARISARKAGGVGGGKGNIDGDQEEEQVPGSGGQ